MIKPWNAPDDRVNTTTVINITSLLTTLFLCILQFMDTTPISATTTAHAEYVWV